MSENQAELSQRITDLEQSISGQISELRAEVGLAAMAMRNAAAGQPVVSPLGDLEEQLARAVTVSLSAALEAIHDSLTDAVANAVDRLAVSVERQNFNAPSGAVVRAQLSPADLDEITASLHHSVLVALSPLEHTAPGSAIVSNEAVATVSDVARVNQRIDELRSLLLG